MYKIMIKIEDEAGWLSVIDSSEERLVIIDIHQDWCGPTEAIHPTLSRVFQVLPVAQLPECCSNLLVLCPLRFDNHNH